MNAETEPKGIYEGTPQTGASPLAASIQDALRAAETALEIEIETLQALRSRMGDAFLGALRLLAGCEGKVVVTGVGKSGHIGRKIAASLASTGTPAFFVHSDEALHGDSGMVGPEDVVVAISNSGETAEVLAFLAILRGIGAPVIAMTGRSGSTLARQAGAVLDVGVAREADPLGLAPTASTVATLAMGDALVSALMALGNFSRKDFARFHPGGALGNMLLTSGEGG